MKLDINHLIASFLCGAILLSMPCQSQQLSIDKKQAIDSLFANWNKPNKPGVAVAILWQDSVVYKNTWGMANIGQNQRINPNTGFWIASVSKQFTAMGIAVLVEQGKINVEDMASLYLPELKQFPQIKIKHLLYHTSGLRDAYTLIGLTFRGEKHYDAQSILEMTTQQRDLNFIPGTRYEYVNSNYVLLSVILERVSKQPLAKFMQENVFRPLGMLESHIFSGVNPTMALGYRANGNRYKRVKHWLPSQGSTGVVASLNDLLALEQKFHQQDKDFRLSFLTEQTTLANGTTSMYARGVEVYTIGRNQLVSHFGSDPGFRADILRLPEQKLSIILLSNAGNYWDLMKHSLLLAGWVVNDSTLIKMGSDSQEATGIDRPNLLEGIYQDTVSIADIRLVKTEQGILKTSGSSQGYFQPLIPLANNHFTTSNVYENDYWFYPDSLIVNRRDGRHVFLKTKTSLGADILSLRGRYYSPELKKTYRITHKKGILRLSIFRIVHVPLTLISAQTFIADFNGTNVISFHQFNSGEKQLYFSREGIKNLVFIKQ